MNQSALLPVTGGGAPTSRMWASLIDDPGSSRVVLFGGGRLTDAWALDVTGETWQALESRNVPKLTRIGGVTAAYDSRAGRMVVLFYKGAGLPAETWTYDLAAGTWENRRPENPPLGRRFTGLAYDAESDRTLLFGGLLSEDYSSPTNETWAYDYQANRWEQMRPASFPPPVFYHQAAYSTGSDRLLVWGGRPGGPENRLWDYDYNTDSWTQSTYTAGPQPDDNGVMVYAPGLDRLFLYVGDQFWSYAEEDRRWVELSGAGGPGRRYGASLVYDEQSQRLVLFGGAGSAADTFFYNPHADEWTRLVE